MPINPASGSRNASAPWDKSDGFSAGSQIMTQLTGATGEEFGGPADIPQSLSENSPSILLDVETGELVPHFAEMDVRAETDEQRATMIRAVVRLRDDARYIVAFRGLHNSDDELVEPSAGFAALRDGTPSEDESIEARRELYDDIFAQLADAGWQRSELQIAWDFNTASDENNTQWLLHMRDTAFDRIEQAGGVQYSITETQADPNSEIAFRILGTVEVPLFMTSPEPASLLVFGDDGMPMVNPDTPWADIPFEIRIPNSAKDSPAAIIEYGHGLFGTKGQIGSGHFQTFMNEYNYIFVATDLQGMSDSDFSTVGAFLRFGNFSATQTMFDRLHQGFLNHLVLLRMMKTSFAADETYGQYVKADEAYYYGISQGGIMGSVVLATTSDVERGALGVLGQAYSMNVFRSKDFTEFLIEINRNYKDFRTHQLLIGLAQMLWDRVEPVGYTHHISENTLPGANPKAVLMRAAIGDHQVPTEAAHVMARTVGAKHLDSGLRDIWGLDKVTSTESGSFYTEYDFGLPGEPLCNVPMLLCKDPHEHLRRRESSRKQLNEFLRNGTGTNHCVQDMVDEHQPMPNGVCSYPTMSECTDETEEDTQALCGPQDLTPDE